MARARQPKQRANLSARELNAMLTAAEPKQGFVDNRLQDDAQSHWVWVRNDSGSDRERFECMALSDPIINLELDGSVDLMFKAIASAADKTPVILLEPIERDAFGRGVIHGLALAKVGSGLATATTATPGTHKLTPGSGSIKLLTAPSTTTDTLMPVLLGAGGASGITDLRLSGANLQYFKDGTWTTWTTGTSC